MKKPHPCSKTTASTGCHTSQASQKVQPFPKVGRLVENLNLPLAVLDARLDGLRGRAVSYVVRTVRWNSGKQCLEQRGSAPNFQGGVLTLCTCKHQMRASQSADDWKNIWIAGFTSRSIYDGRHWLFYLARVERVFESQSDLWNGMTGKVREAKAARQHYLGDMFMPKAAGLAGNARYSPSRYYSPSVHAHRKDPSDTGWHNDISYIHADRHERQPPLLVATPRLTFLWEGPVIFLNQDHCRDFFRWPSLEELLARLQEAGR